MLHEPSVSVYIAQVPWSLNVNSVKYEKEKKNKCIELLEERYHCLYKPQVVNQKDESLTLLPSSASL